MTSSLPAEAWAVALATLPRMGPARLLALLRAWPPEAAWREVSEGSWRRNRDVVATTLSERRIDLVSKWREVAAHAD
ncbi:MAG TPA: hypothetical protein VGZ52_08790, partial [Acidimicrobiales bacterium]|nr:hypothetical protein [Acidimicrobiales bacterium]